jgi:preprotein translocase subunit SecG
MFYFLRLQAVVLAVLFFLCFLCLSATSSFAQSDSNSSSFTLLFTNNMAGDYKPCGG